MRSSITRLATASKYLTAGNPTGLTGILTHPSPRTELIAIYSATLAKLDQFPASSAYRNAAEALTKHRLAHTESIKPAGWDEWKTGADKLLEKYPNLFRVGRTRKQFVRHDVNGKIFITERFLREVDPDEVVFESGSGLALGDDAESEDAAIASAEQAAKIEELEVGEGEWVAEPKLDADQISMLEEKIGAGLIEEVIEVAKGEFKLVETMLENKVWEELQDKPAPGQWDYFQRDSHVSGTQEPPKV